MSRLQRVLRTPKILAALLVAFVAIVVPSTAAYADPGCAQPVARLAFDSSGSFIQGRGEFSCNHVYDVASRVQVFRYEASAGDYILRDGSGWVERGRIIEREQWVTRTNWMTALCGRYSVRATVRFKYSPGQTSYTMREDINNIVGTCG